MKIAVLVAAYRHDVDTGIEVTDRFPSAAPGAPRYRLARARDDDPQVWARLGGTASLGWLAERMIVTSSNLATNLVLRTVGIPAADAVWREVGARHSRIGRGIGDVAAREAGITNEVTAYDLALLLDAIARDGGRALATLHATRHRDDLAAGLPPGTHIAHKSGWVTGVRHGAGIVYPRDRPPYLLVVLSSTTLPDAAARTLLARIAAASWSVGAGRSGGQ